MGKLKLTVNEEKTRICKVPEGTFDFLGYLHRSSRYPYNLEQHQCFNAMLLSTFASLDDVKVENTGAT
jgi:hypothetical protein